MIRRQLLSRFSILTLAVVFALSSTVLAKPKSGGKQKGGADTSFTGIVQSFSKTQIVLVADGDKTKTKVFMVDDKTTITGNIEHGAKVTVNFSGNKATSIAASS